MINIESSMRELFGAQDKAQPESFDQVAVTLASPEIVRSWSSGEVKNPETINYRSFRPEKGGLFCERIFGPTRDWECSCGKYKRIKYKGVTCDRCGVDVTVSKVRRERMGHIELAVPVAHIWFYKCIPSRIGLLLDITGKRLERVIYYEDYIVLEPGDTPLEQGEILNEQEFIDAEEQFGVGSFRAGMGADAIRDILVGLKLPQMGDQIEQDMRLTKSKANLKKLTKRLKLVQGFLKSHTRPEWMVMDVLPVIPPDLRPLVPLEGGRFATSDLNDLYRRVINRNNRLKNLLQLRTPEVIIRNEKRMLQEAVDALMDNGRHGRAVTGAGNRPLKSLSDMLKGKGGRFRQNLLGKRVDYSGRSVIVVGPELKLHQCGLPKKMALTLFEPFIIKRLKEMGLVHTVRSAKKLIEKKTPEVWDILEEVSTGHPVLLNRAPTLHRLSIQAFEPVLIEGEAIRVHPLVCTAYNADFDGDQMAVHVPLSYEAQLEARLLMLASNNIYSPGSGRPITTPSQDITLGAYFLTHLREMPVKGRKKRVLPLFCDRDEVEFAVAEGVVGLYQRIRFRNPDKGRETPYGDAQATVIETTPGRVRFNELWPEEIGFVNTTVGKKLLGQLIWDCAQLVGRERAVDMLDHLKNLGFKEATRSGCSIGITDMIIPDEKPKQLAAAYELVDEVEGQYRSGVITDGERSSKIIDIWSHAGDEISKSLATSLEYNDGKLQPNPLHVMVDSGARGNQQQIKQLSGMRGLMAKPSGEIIERPITSNFREGLSVLEYFVSTHGARKGLADTALKTADSGYMTRKLVDVAQDVIITEEDCGALEGITVSPIYEGDEEVVDIKTRIVGRTILESIPVPVSKKSKNGKKEFIAKENDTLSMEQAERLQEIGCEKVKIRSALTCESDRGICAKCYGIHLATWKPVALGESVGIIAAQSIGEPGTQLTMRTFHVGGTASTTFKQPVIKAKQGGKVHYENVRSVENDEGKQVALTKNGIVHIRNSKGKDLESHKIVVGAAIHVPDGGKIRKDQPLATWDPYNVPIISEVSGLVEFRDLIIGVTMTKDKDEATGADALVIMEHKEDLHPQIVVSDPDSREPLASYAIPTGAHLSVAEGESLPAGARIARTPRKVAKTKDITGGLPRVSELFEARRPKEAAHIAKIAGIVELSPRLVRSKRNIIVRAPDGTEEKHLLPRNKHLIVHNGDQVERGESLTEGPYVPHDILEILGPSALQNHLLNEVQEVYRLQGVEINDKHIEIIIRQMMRKVRITDTGDTHFLWGDQVDRIEFRRVNRQVEEDGGVPAEGEPVLLGITKASLETESFISAASFQDTTRVLTDAATLGRVDVLRGFKENVIMGRLVPAGTGYRGNRDFDAVENVGEEELERLEVAREAALEAAEIAAAASPLPKPSPETLAAMT